MDECECLVPKEYADPRKHMCRVCGNFLSRSSEELGRLHTKLDAAIVSLELPEHEIRLFLRAMSNSVSVDTRQKHKTWDFNYRQRQRTAAA